MESRGKKVVVIGTGAGGLMAAGYLAKYGHEVVALEQAPQLGGYLNSFARKRYHFDPGVHYMGECAEGKLVYRLLAGLGLEPSQLFYEMDPDGFDVYRFPDFEVALCKGVDRFRDRLKTLFPAERKGIDRFYDVYQKLGRAFALVYKLTGERPSPRDLAQARTAPLFLRLVFTTYRKFLRGITRDERLQAALCGPLAAVGMPPSRVSAAFALSLFLHFGDGAYFPRGGGGGLRDALVGAAEGFGARFRTRADVKRIELRDGVATGVTLTDGEFVEADAVVSAIEPALTYGQLIELKDLPRRLTRKVIHTRPSLGSFYVFLGLKRDLGEYGLGPRNVWEYYTHDMEALFDDSLAGRLPERFALIASPNSLKDDPGRLAPKGCTTLELMALAPYEPFARWDGMRSYKRGAEYEDLKNSYGQKIIDRFDELHPGVIGDVAVQELATPVTNSYWVRAVKGGTYGPAMSIDQTVLFRYRTKSPFPNVVLAGSGVFGCGVASCLMSGLVAAKMTSKAGRRR